MRALLSVYDKSGIVEFAGALVDLGFEIVSTGGTLHALRGRGIPATSVSDVTGVEEMLQGRVKTLHPAIHGGILGRPGLESDAEEMRRHGIRRIAVLAVNLYPFEETAAKVDVTDAEVVEQIDIGGPAMLRAAAKNHEHVLPIVDPASYGEVVERLRAQQVDLAFRRELAAVAFAHTSAYDAAIARYLGGDDAFPEVLNLTGKRIQTLRYGENPHQRAAAYRSFDLGAEAGVLNAVQLQGKELSFNNLLDADAAWSCVRDASAPTMAIVKHTIPCGLAEAETLDVAYDRAFAGDPVSAFGGVVACSREVDGATASKMIGHFFEVVIAPGFSAEARETFSRKRHLRLLECGAEVESPKPTYDLKVVSGGWLMQDADTRADEENSWVVVSDRQPNGAELGDLRFAWRAVRHIKSNAIVLVTDRAVVGVGSGQPNRVESVSIAGRKAGERAAGAVMASDAFFPFPDSIEAAAAVGVAAVIQPGGSIRDSDVIAAANTAGMAMIFTGRRHFRH
jgi:phosphoribosylaminoimidazolecarboxamide formyltransferase/IMP cyclohydrolase